MEKTNKAYAILMGLPEIQRLNLRLMELATFNEFDGPRVVLSLLSNKDLWQACLMDRESFCDPQVNNERHSSLSICLIKLRDMSDETTARLGRQCWHVDTLFILPMDDKRTQVRLYELAKTWKADEVDWIEWPVSGELLGGGMKGQRILRVWWD